MSTRRAGFAKFYHRSTDDRLRAVLVRAGDLRRARISISRLTSRARPGPNGAKTRADSRSAVKPRSMAVLHFTPGGELPGPGR